MISGRLNVVQCLKQTNQIVILKEFNILLAYGQSWPGFIWLETGVYLRKHEPIIWLIAYPTPRKTNGTDFPKVGILYQIMEEYLAILFKTST
jgi:hypothetical protein